MGRQGDPADLRLLVIILRALRKWTQEELSADSGVDRGLISDYERGAKAPTRRTLRRLTAAVGLPHSFVATLLPMFRTARLAVEANGTMGTAPPVGEAPGDVGEGLAEAIEEAVLSRLAPHLLELQALLADKASPSAEDRNVVEELWRSLSALQTGRRRLVVEEERKYWTWALVEKCCEESESSAAHKADRAVELAGLALRIAELVQGNETWRWRLQGYVWAFIGNARRVQGDLRGSEEAFGCSERLWKAGAPADPGLLDGTRLLDLRASLSRHQGRFDEALSLLDQAFSASASAEARGRILHKTATTLAFRGDYEQSIEVLRQAEPLVAGSQDLRLPGLVQHNLAYSLWRAGRFAEAAALLPEVRRQAEALGNDLDLVRVLWVEGGVAAGLGRPEEAVLLLERVRRHFTANQIAYDAALVSLELAALLLDDGQTGKVKRLAEEMLWIFTAQGVQQEALAALRLFCAAAKKEEATVELTRRILGEIERASRSGYAAE